MADAGSTRDIASIVDQTIRKFGKFGKFDILIPSAAINPLANLEELTEELYDRMDAVNVKGALFLAKVCHINWC
jgi:NAD(P)-dependent dehydrogenase (short-subunit alcohol dehydrogenase family)